jgi:hypothetical protein
MRVVRVVQTCEACPSQWEGFLADGRAFYARFRGGCLSVTAHATFPLADDADLLLEQCDGSNVWDGHMPYEQFRDRLRQAGIDAPDAMESDSKWHHHIVPALS